MKIQLFSDLHNEFSSFTPPQISADVVVLAGDIDVLTRGVRWANSELVSHVIYCCGNHEYYKGHIDRTLAKMKALAASHVHVLENEIWIHGQTRFLVATGWTDFSSTGDVVAAAATCAREMNDFRMIRATPAYRRLRPHDLLEKNRATYEFLSKQLGTSFPGQTVVVTHHCPIPEVSGEKHDGHISAGYFNRWYNLVEKADVWLFGHTHCSVDVVLGDCRLVSNPRGYPHENTGFIDNCIIEI